MKEILRLHILLDDFNHVESDKGKITFIRFHGNAKSDLFEGIVCSGGVDTQIHRPGEYNMISARYILEGKDFAGAPCKIFIENNGVDRADGTPMDTVPEIFTDSPNLKWLENAVLSGQVCWEDGELIIHIFVDDTQIR